MDKFDIHKWQRDAYNVLNEANSEAAFEVYKTITNSKKYNSLKYDERKYVADKLYQDLFLTPPNDIKDITTEEVNAYSKIEQQLKDMYAKELGVEGEDVKFVDLGTPPTVEETVIEDVCNAIVKLLGKTIRIVPEIAAQDKLENFLTAIIEGDVNGIYRVTKNYTVAGIDSKTGDPTVFWKKLTWGFMTLVIDSVVLTAKLGCWAGDFPFKVAVLVISKYGPGTEGFPKDKD